MTMKQRHGLAWGLAFLLVAAGARAQPKYAVGDTVQNFQLIDRATGRAVSLYDLEGNVIFLEWFAYWCPFCQAAAAEIEPDIVQYYADRAGNAHGVPVKHVALNLQGDAEAATQQFVDFYHLGQVLNDFGGTVASRFQTGGQPIFAIINGVQGSPSHRQWKLLYSQLGYGMLDFPIATYRGVIDSVQAASVDPGPGPAPEPDPVAVPLITYQPMPQTVAPGQRAELLVSATGGGVLTYQWWRNGVALSGRTGPRLTIAAAAAGNAGDYTVVVSNAAGAVTSASAHVTVDAAADGRLVNLSSLAYSGEGADQLVPGFVAVGPMRLLVRAVGPSLEAFGVPGRLANPEVNLASGSTFLVHNDDWSGEGAAYAEVVRAAGSQVGAFALTTGSQDSALVYDYDGGPRSAPVSDVAGGTGAVLVEVYDVPTAGRTGRLVNLATRGVVRAGENLVAGFVLDGTGARTVLIRGVGPGLGAYGVPGVLADPQLNLASGGTVITGNADWADDPVNAAEVAALGHTAGAFDLAAGSRDAAMVVTLSPGLYTVQISGPAGASGVVLAEIYDVTGL